MATVMQFYGLLAIACAIYSGLRRIAEAIRYRVVDVRFKDPLEVKHAKEASRGPR